MKLSRSEVLVLAGTASVSPITAQRYAQGLPVRPMLRERIEQALEKLGLPSASTTPATPASGNAGEK